MKFTKMQGIGNDFILINLIKTKLSEDYSALAKRACDRHFGIGADGLILLLPSNFVELRARFFNPDGSEAEMCGNGMRCLAKYLYERKLVKRKEFKVETKAGIIIPKLILSDDQVEAIEVDMGIPQLKRIDIPMKGEGERVVDEELEIDGKKFKITALSLGNPHCLLFVERLDSSLVSKVGPQIENHPLFPQRTNVEFVQVLNKEEIELRVWERGVGETLACGSGACAAVVGCVLNDKTERKVKVHLRGGDLLVEWRDNDHLYLTGEAREVFEGEI